MPEYVVAIRVKRILVETNEVELEIDTTLSDRWEQQDYRLGEADHVAVTITVKQQEAIKYEAGR